jgi:hypothetical protein
MLKRLLLAILNTDAPTLLRMRLWVPVLVVLLVLASVLGTERSGSGSVTFSGPWTSVDHAVVETALGSAIQLEVRWTESSQTPEFSAELARQRRASATILLGPSASALLPASDDWGPSPLRLSDRPLLIDIMMTARWIGSSVLLPLMLVCIVISLLRWSQRLWLRSAPVLWASGTCPKCNYVIGIGGLTTCPECGTTYSTPSPEPEAVESASV